MLEGDNNLVICSAQLSPVVQNEFSKLYEVYTNKLKPLLALEETVAGLHSYCR